MTGNELITFGRVAAALSWVEEHLDEKITVADVAQRAFYSPFHFHRMFRGLTGESLMDFIRRRRLTVAAASLKAGHRPIIQIAFDAGFDSQEAFTRAFKVFSGTTPGRYRREGGGDLPLKVSPFSRELLRTHCGGRAMQPKLKELPEFRIAGLAGSYVVGKTEGIPGLWERFIKLWMKGGSGFPSVSYGICYDESEGVTGGEMPFTYLAAFPIENDAAVPEGLEARTIAANRYAVFTHRGPVMKIKDTYEKIYGNWLMDSGYRPGSGPEFELYDERFNEETMSGEVDIYVPVVRAS